MTRDTRRPDLSDPAVIEGLVPRSSPYFNLVSYCRHIGLQKRDEATAFWVARVRRADGGYTQHRLGPALMAHIASIGYSEALDAAAEWFDRPDIRAVVSRSWWKFEGGVISG